MSVEPVELPELEPVELSELEPVELDAVSVTVVIPVVVGACPAVPPQAALKSPSSRNFCGRPTGRTLSGLCLRAKDARPGEDRPARDGSLTAPIKPKQVGVNGCASGVA